ncbi:hypothetical protein MAMT_01254 [Methylacidimicrobium tartarophylax]|uniref:Uncharacterized protein n=1 Tax=Methylacidimicrobium tartarophylax TaxID=1041768 RepID=A0A5E6MFA5_9BACT|nr:hypothetical protein MAMT_01254 [Methylacidimicrobium tartarophylax]
MGSLADSMLGQVEYRALENRHPLLIGHAVLREVVAGWKAEVKI